jgi:hypothetical protein
MKEILGDCPLGSVCEQVKQVNGEQVLVRCPWHIKMRGKDPQSENEIDEWGCAIAWMPILQVEHSQFERQTGAAVESMRNEVKKSQEKLMQLKGPGDVAALR